MCGACKEELTAAPEACVRVLFSNKLCLEYVTYPHNYLLQLYIQTHLGGRISFSVQDSGIFIVESFVIVCIDNG